MRAARRPSSSEVEDDELVVVGEEELKERHDLEALGVGEQALDVCGLVGLEQPLGAIDEYSSSKDRNDHNWRNRKPI